MGLFSQKSKWKSGLYSIANKAFEAVTDQRELMQIVQECPHGLIRLRAASRLSDDEALLAELMETLKIEYQNRYAYIASQKFTPQTEDTIRLNWRKEADWMFSDSACPLVWVAQKYPQTLVKWADDPLLMPYVREEAAASLNAEAAMKRVQPLPLLLFGSANGANAPFFFMLILIRLYRVYPEGFSLPQTDWSVDELSKQAAKLPQGEEHKQAAAQFVRLIGLYSRRGWADNNLAPEILERFGVVMPQKENLRAMWSGYVK